VFPLTVLHEHSDRAVERAIVPPIVNTARPHRMIDGRMPSALKMNRRLPAAAIGR
jgi:hypothetical protein